MGDRTGESEREVSTAHGRVLVRLCSDKVAYEARPERPQRYDLKKVQAVVTQGNRYATVVFTPYLIVLRRENVDITMAQDGRLIIRKADSEASAKAMAEELFSLLSSASIDGG